MSFAPSSRLKRMATAAAAAAKILFDEILLDHTRSWMHSPASHTLCEAQRPDISSLALSERGHNLRIARSRLSLVSCRESVGAGDTPDFVVVEPADVPCQEPSHSVCPVPEPGQVKVCEERHLNPLLYGPRCEPKPPVCITLPSVTPP